MRLIFVSFFFCPLIHLPIVHGHESALFHYLRTIVVTPDDNFQTGSFARINYVPATDHFVVTFGTKSNGESGIGKGGGYAYKEYNLDMEETGNTGLLTWDPDAEEANDSGSEMVENTYYFVHVPTDTAHFYGWRVTKYDAVNFQKQAEIYITLHNPYEPINDPMVAFVNGQIDISSQYDPVGHPPPLDEGAATSHRFFSTNLDSLDSRILADTPHICGSSMVFVDGIYYMVTADAFLGDLIVMKYDEHWNYLGMKKLIPDAHWSQGLIFDGMRFYVSYLSTIQRAGPVSLPVHLNVHLAAFDREWNLLDDIPVTNFTPSDHRQPGRPWVKFHHNWLYVSYDVDAVDPNTGEEQKMWQANVSVYELNPDFNSVESSRNIPGKFHLEQNFPNPFNSSTRIRFSIPKSDFVVLTIYNLLGEEIETLIEEQLQASEHEIEFSAKDLASGIYLYRLESGNFIETRKMILQR